jgi:hypothetical protein
MRPRDQYNKRLNAAPACAWRAGRRCTGRCRFFDGLIRKGGKNPLKSCFYVVFGLFVGPDSMLFPPVYPHNLWIKGFELLTHVEKNHHFRL